MENLCCLFIAHASRKCILLGDRVVNEMAPRFCAWGAFSGEVTLGHVVVVPKGESSVRGHVVFSKTEARVDAFSFCGCKFGECKVPHLDLFRFIAFASWGGCCEHLITFSAMILEVEDGSILCDQPVSCNGRIKAVVHDLHFGWVPRLRHVGSKRFHLVMTQ